MIPGITQWVKGSGVAMSGDVGHSCCSDLALLWLWCRPAAAAPIQPLAWELPYDTGASLKRKKKKDNNSKIAITSPGEKRRCLTV